MDKKLLIQFVVYFSAKHIEALLQDIYAQTYTDFDVQAVICDGSDGATQIIADKFPQVRLVDAGSNIGFGSGHNLGFKHSNHTFVLLLNPDMRLQSTFVEEMMRVMENDSSIAGVQCKIYRLGHAGEPLQILDSTGVIVYKTGRARDRGQLENDSGQFDKKTDLMAVTGAAPLYRRSALNEVAHIVQPAEPEIFDDSFFMYWEDVDLSLRLLHAGYKLQFAPNAVGYHVRRAGSIVSGYKKVLRFVQHHKQFPQWLLDCNYLNHISFVIKNFPRITIFILLREIFMLGYIAVFETRTLRMVPKLAKRMPVLWQKRKRILAASKLTKAQFNAMFEKHPTDF